MKNLKNWFKANAELSVLSFVSILFVVSLIVKIEKRNKLAMPVKDNNEEIDQAIKSTWFNIYSVSEGAYVHGCQQGFERTCKLLKTKEQKSCFEYSGSYCKDAAKDYRKKATSVLSTGN